MRLFHSLVAVLTLLQLSFAVKFSNPLKNPNGSDPFIVFHDGYYYLTTTTWTDVQITRATTINGLKTGERKVVWKDSNPDRCCNVWAPEIHEIDGTWYLYYTAGQSKDLGYQRPYVLRGGASPWDSYKFMGRLANTWGIDATVGVIGTQRYFIWSCKPAELQSLCIAPMTSPSTIGRQVIISEPRQSWEKAEGELAVNEGPALLHHAGKTFLVYSASYCWTKSYALAYLELKNGATPLSMASWTKVGPVFTSANGAYGPGHNGFFKSPDGTQDWNVYHATTNSKGSCDGNRYTAVAPVTWAADGKPQFGRPIALNTVMEGPSGENGTVLAV